MEYEFIEFNCPKCGKYHIIHETELYDTDNDYIICDNCNTKLDIDLKLDDYDEIIGVVVTEFEEV